MAAVLLEPSLKRSSRQQLPDRSLTPIGREPVLLASQRGLELELGGRTSKARQPATASRWDLLDGERRSGVGSEPVSMISYTTLQRGLLFSYGRVCLHPNIRITALSAQCFQLSYPHRSAPLHAGAVMLDAALKRVVVSVVSLELPQLDLLSSSYDGRAWGMPRRSAVAAWEDNMVPPCGAGTYSHCRHQRARRHRMRVVRGHHARARA